MNLKTQTLWSMLPLITVTAANLLSVPLFYRYLGAEQYGLWFYVLTLTGAFGFMDLGLGVAVGRYVGLALGRNDAVAVREFWGTGNLIAIPLLLVMAAGFCVVGVVFGHKWFQVPSGSESLLQWCFIAAGPGLFLSYYGQFWNILAQAHLDFRFMAVARTVTAIVSLAVAIGLSRATSSILILVWWSTVVAALQLAVFVLHSIRNYGLHWNLANAKWDRASEMMSYTVKTFFTVLFSAFAGTIDRIVLGKLIPATLFTYYSIANNVGLRVQGLGSAVLGPVFHQSNRAVADSEAEGVRRIHADAFSMLFGWCLLGTTVISLWKLPLLQLWLGKELAEQVAPLFLPVVLACAIQLISSISGAQLSSLDRQGTVMVVQVARVVLVVLGGTIGWKIGGLPGFAWGILVSRGADIAQDILLMSIVGRIGWMTAPAGRTLGIQLAIAAVFYLLGTTVIDWRLGAALGILHFACGAIPQLSSWVAPKFKTMVWSSAE